MKFIVVKECQVGGKTYMSGDITSSTNLPPDCVKEIEEYVGDINMGRKVVMRKKKFSLSHLPDIVIPHYNRADRLKECLESIPKGFNVYVIRGGTFAENCNKGFKLTKGRDVIFCNDDIVFNEEFLEEFISRNDPLLGTIRVDKKGKFEPVHWYFYCAGACFKIRRELFKKLGGFNEIYKNGYEDRELFLKAMELGYNLNFTKNYVLHYGSQSEGRFANHVENEKLFLSRWTNEKVMRICLPTISVITPVGKGRKIMFPESLENQCYPKEKIEHIIIEDKKNRGANWARNQGLKKAKNEMIFFLDDDIKLEPDCFSKLALKLRKEPQYDYAYCNYHREGCLTGDHRAKEFDYKTLRETNYISAVSLIRRDKFPKKLDESIKRFQDWDWWLTMAKNGSIGGFVDKFLFTAYYKKDGISCNPENFKKSYQIIKNKHNL